MAYTSPQSVLQFARLQDKRTLRVMRSTSQQRRWWCVSKNRELLGVICIDADDNYVYQGV